MLEADVARFGIKSAAVRTVCMAGLALHKFTPTLTYFGLYCFRAGLDKLLSRQPKASECSFVRIRSPGRGRELLSRGRCANVQMAGWALRKFTPTLTCFGLGCFPAVPDGFPCRQPKASECSLVLIRSLKGEGTSLQYESLAFVRRRQCTCRANRAMNLQTGYVDCQRTLCATPS